MVGWPESRGLRRLLAMPLRGTYLRYVPRGDHPGACAHGPLEYEVMGHPIAVQLKGTLWYIQLPGESFTVEVSIDDANVTFSATKYLEINLETVNSCTLQRIYVLPQADIMEGKIRFLVLHSILLVTKARRSASTSSLVPGP